MVDKLNALIELLKEQDGWSSAQSLSEKLGVSTRSVRSYISAAKAKTQPHDVILTSSSGYRLSFEDYAKYRSAIDLQPERYGSTPRERMNNIVQKLSEHPGGLSIDELSSSMHVSSATVELDVKKIRALSNQFSVTLERNDNVLSLRGDEASLRRLLSDFVYESNESGILSLDTIALRFELPRLIDFKTDLIERLDYHHYFINEYGIDSVLLHLAIAVDRVRQGLTIPAQEQVLDDDTTKVATIVRDLAKRHFGIELGTLEERYLARQLVTRVITPGDSGSAEKARADLIDRETTANALDLVYREYLIDLRNDDLIDRLALHIGHLVTRAEGSFSSRNPLQKTIKTSYPLVWDIAVFIASAIHKERNIEIDEDEISYIALHIGSHLERQAQAKNRVSATIVTPSYYDLHIVMRESIEKILGNEITIESVITRTDVRQSDIETDIVITTIPLDLPQETIVQVQPFLSEDDIDTVRRTISRARKTKRHAIMRERLLEYFRPETFFRDLPFDSPEQIIRKLGDSLKSLKIIGDDYVAGAIEREQLSSTVFVDGLAVPHAMSMTAKQPTIAIAVNQTPGNWGNQKVSVVAFIAFAASGRDEFQSVFEQFVDVFADRAHMAEVVRQSDSFEAFIDAMVHIIEG